MSEEIEELESGGIEDLIDVINESFGRLPSSSSSTCEYSRSRRGKLSGGIGNLLNFFSHAGHSIILNARSRGPSPELPRDASLGLTTAPDQSTHPVSPGGSLSGSSGNSTLGPPAGSDPSNSSTLTQSCAWIHLCIESYTGRLRLKSVNVSDLPTDRLVFSAIHGAYFGDSLLRSCRRIFSLRELISVRCVHVSYVAAKALRLSCSLLSLLMISRKQFNLFCQDHIAIEADEVQKRATSC